MTVENDFQCVQLNDGSIIKLWLLDTAGQETFNSITENYYQQANCCLLVYDITSKDSYYKVKSYYAKKIKHDCKNILKVVLLGNKADLKDRRQVSDIEGANLALENGYTFMESSCVDNYNVLDAFTALIEMTNSEIKKSKDIKNDDLKKIKLNNNATVVKKRKCC